MGKRMVKHERQARLKKINNNLLPELETQKQVMADEVAVLRGEITALQSESVELAASLIEPVKAVPTVSDHALVRYLERHYNFDMDKFRDEILDDSAKSAIRSGATTINRNGLKFKVRNNVIATIL